MSTYFSILLVVLTLVSGLIWLLDSLIWAPKRKQKLLAVCAVQGLSSDQTGIEQLSAEVVDAVAPMPLSVDNARQMFPFIAAITIFRSFIFEPFQIPSGSMMSTLLVGDFILVDKFSYGIKDPVTRSQWIDIGQPERGDVAVFKYPLDPTKDYIKRVVGLPGDRVSYRNKQIKITPACDASQQNDCVPSFIVSTEFVEHGQYQQAISETAALPQTRYIETLGERKHEILITRGLLEQKSEYFKQSGLPRGTWQVPEGHYFVMGDNRNNSIDSRFFGFVSKDALVGKAKYVWMSFEKERLASDWLPMWVPSGVRFSRVGSIH